MYMRPASIMVLGGIVTDIPSNSDLNNYTEAGKYRVQSNAGGQSIVNCPYSGSFYLEVLYGLSYSLQRLTGSNANVFFIRRYQKSSGNWTSWYRFEGVAVTS